MGRWLIGLGFAAMLAGIPLVVSGLSETATVVGWALIVPGAVLVSCGIYFMHADGNAAWENEQRDFRDWIRRFMHAIGREKRDWDRLAPHLRWHAFPYDRSPAEWRKLLADEWSKEECEAFAMLDRIYRGDALGASSSLGRTAFRKFHKARTALKQRYFDVWGNRRGPVSRRRVYKIVRVYRWQVAWWPYIEMVLAEHLQPAPSPPSYTGLWRLIEYLRDGNLIPQVPPTPSTPGNGEPADPESEA